jgi:hypothetical protein
MLASETSRIRAGFHPVGRKNADPMLRTAQRPRGAASTPCNFSSHPSQAAADKSADAACGAAPCGSLRARGVADVRSDATGGGREGGPRLGRARQTLAARCHGVGAMWRRDASTAGKPCLRDRPAPA